MFLVNTGDPDNEQRLPAIAINPPSGQMFIAWEDEAHFTGAGEVADPDSIRGNAFLATTDDVNGSAGSDDSIQTFNLERDDLWPRRR